MNTARNNTSLISYVGSVTGNRQDSALVQIIGIVAAIVGAVLLAYIIDQLIEKIIDNLRSSVDILSRTKTAKRRDRYDGKRIVRSHNKDGIELSYSVWMYVDDWTYKIGKWKHVFHKGGQTYGEDSPENTLIKCPGVWLDPNQNTLHIYINTYNNPNEKVSIENFPLNKWVNVIFTIKGKIVDVFLNGEFTSRTVLSSIPRQNYGDIVISRSRGYSGYISRIKYFNYVIPYSTIEDIVKLGPNRTPCADTGEYPPY